MIVDPKGDVDHNYHTKGVVNSDDGDVESISMGRGLLRTKLGHHMLCPSSSPCRAHRRCSSTGGHRCTRPPRWTQGGGGSVRRGRRGWRGKRGRRARRGGAGGSGGSGGTASSPHTPPPSVRASGTAARDSRRCTRGRWSHAHAHAHDAFHAHVHVHVHVHVHAHVHQISHTAPRRTTPTLHYTHHTITRL